MKEHEQYLLDVIQGRRPFKNPNPKLGEGKYYYLDPNQEYDDMAPARPDQKTYVPSEDSPNPYLQPRPQAQQSQQQPQFQGYASVSGSIPNAAARMHSSALDNKKYAEHNLKKPSAEMAKIKPFLRGAEGLEEHPYRDIYGKVTVCEGHMVPNPNKNMIEFPWLDKTTNMLASNEKINTDSSKLTNLPYGPNYTADFYKDKTDLKLPPEYCKKLLDHDLAVREKELSRGFPNYNRMSPDMQRALMDVHYQSNAFNKKRPQIRKLHDAARQFDKENFCKALMRDDSKRPDLKPRNEWVYEQCQKGYFIK